MCLATDSSWEEPLNSSPQAQRSRAYMQEDVGAPVLTFRSRTGEQLGFTATSRGRVRAYPPKTFLKRSVVRAAGFVRIAAPSLAR